MRRLLRWLALCFLGAPSFAPLHRQVAKALRTRCGVPLAPVPLLLCVSGGLDSVALLLLVQRAAGPWRLHVVHFNHGLRPEAKEEEDFVAELCGRLKVACTVRHGDVAVLKGSRLGLQAEARRWRREEALKILETLGSDGAILLAHHADDQAWDV